MTARPLMVNYRQLLSAKVGLPLFHAQKTLLASLNESILITGPFCVDGNRPSAGVR
jgi:hypothetical protein